MNCCKMVNYPVLFLEPSFNFSSSFFCPIAFEHNSTDRSGEKERNTMINNWNGLILLQETSSTCRISVCSELLIYFYFFNFHLNSLLGIPPSESQWIRNSCDLCKKFKDSKQHHFVLLLYVSCELVWVFCFHGYSSELLRQVMASQPL